MSGSSGNEDFVPIGELVCSLEPGLASSADISDPATGGSRVLTGECSTCIFRPGNLMALRSGRVKDLVQAALADETFIVCHQTLDRGKDGPLPAVCGGFARRYDTAALRLMRALGRAVDVDPGDLEGP
ncbi:hypothetical protein AB0I28_32520 [Phytomonospora sp. NPDC050363]|uniref:hypothetical protein n=1 Tax=Phytomonospora sp. NPDC050363 TaxID=3155642 RepID=UPI0033D802C0